MITGAIVRWFGEFVGWLGSLLSLPDPPAFLGQAAGFAATAAGYVASTSSWAPWSLIVLVLAAWAVCLAAALTLKLVRIVASFLTAGGGSAA